MAATVIFLILGMIVVHQPIATASTGLEDKWVPRDIDGKQVLEFRHTVDGAVTTIQLSEEDGFGRLVFETSTNLPGLVNYAEAQFDRIGPVQIRVNVYDRQGTLLNGAILTTAAGEPCGECDDISAVGDALCAAAGGHPTCQVIMTTAAGLACAAAVLAICNFLQGYYDPDFPCFGATHYGSLRTTVVLMSQGDAPVSGYGGWPANKGLHAFWYFAGKKANQEVQALDAATLAVWRGSTGSLPVWNGTLRVSFPNYPDIPVPNGMALLCVRSGGGPAYIEQGSSTSNTQKACVMIQNGKDSAPVTAAPQNCGIDW
jgi:hypothetical protein